MKLAIKIILARLDAADGEPEVGPARFITFASLQMSVPQGAEEFGCIVYPATVNGRRTPRPVRSLDAEQIEGVLVIRLPNESRLLMFEDVSGMAQEGMLAIDMAQPQNFALGFYLVAVRHDSLRIEPARAGGFQLVGDFDVPPKATRPRGIRIKTMDMVGGTVRGVLTQAAAAVIRDRFPDDAVKDDLAAHVAHTALAKLRSSPHQSARAKHSRVATLDQILRFRDEWIKKNEGRTRGWKRGAMKWFGIKDVRTLNKTLKEAGGKVE